METVRGVNLGGWLVLERWISPSVFAGTDASDEYSLCQNYPDLARERIQKHRQSFITQQTIDKISRAGLNTVRVPIGYWLFGDTPPYIDGADKQIAQLLKWCEQAHLGVILDIHAVPGSQNGWDHSGRSGNIEWCQGENVAQTLSFLEQVCERFVDHPMIIGVELLNEPHWEVDMDTLMRYYLEGYELVRRYSDNVTVILSDAFRPDAMAKRIKKAKLQRTTLDVHLYQLFTEDDRLLDLAGHIDKTSREWPRLLKRLSRSVPVIVGEWSAAMHELYQHIDQPAHVLAYGSEDYALYARTQRTVFEANNAGWFYWTARTENGGPWSLLDNIIYLD